jgi:DNA mismatch repair protein MSH6
MVDQVKAELDEYLEQVKSKFKERRIVYSHAKDRYSIEIPEDHVKGNKKPKEFEFSSARAGYQRFITPETKAFVERLEKAEDTLKDSMAPFLTAIF